MDEVLASSVEPREKLPRTNQFLEHLLKKFRESEGTRESASIPTMRKLRKKMSTLESSGLEKILKNSLSVFGNAFRVLEAWKIQRSSELEDLRSLPSDGVNNGSKDVSDGGGDRRAGETPRRIIVIKRKKRRKCTVIPLGTDGLESSVQPDNHVSSVPDADGGQNPSHGTYGLERSVQPDNHVSSVPDADGGQNPAHGTYGLERSVQPDNHVSSVPGAADADGGENPGPMSDVPDADGGQNPAHGTDGLERSVQYFMEPKLWQVVNEWGNWKRKLEELYLETDRNTPSLKKITNRVGSEFPRLVQLRDRNPSLSLKDMKVYCGPLCWSSKKRVDFWSHLSDKLLSRADELKELRLELERTWQLHFGKKWNDKIVDKLLSRANELKKLMSEFKRTWQPLFGEKRNDKMVDELLSRVDELKEFMSEFKRTWQLHFSEKRNDKIVGELVSRVDELSSRADKLLSRADKLKKLRLELERTWQLHFRRIDEKWIEKYGEEWRQYLGKNWFRKIDERWIQNNGRIWIDKISSGWIRKIKTDYRPRDSNGIFVRDLLRFIRNRRHHLDEFQESRFHSSVKSFYNYFDARFPNLFLVSYGVAYQLCRDEPWFKEYR